MEKITMGCIMQDLPTVEELSICFKIDKEAGLAVDEKGFNADAFLKVTIGFNKEMSDAEKVIIKRHFKEIVCHDFDLDPELVEMISEEEYNAEMGVC